MKLATMQRPHAPPVPPRPSRQVVAEALKRTARLPLPTRQAPPPPNTQPWRPNDKSNTPTKGRTVVYESVKDVKQVFHGCGNSNNELTKPVVVKTQQECLSKSERTITTMTALVENQRERQQQDQQQPVVQHNSENNSEKIAPFCERITTEIYPIENVENTITSSAVSRKDVVTSECTLPTMKIHDTKDIQVEESNSVNDDSAMKDHNFTQHNTKSEIINRNLNVNNNLLKSSTKTKSYDFITKCENIFKAATGKLSTSQTIPSTVTTSINDNCATVVVVEKSERKVAINSDNKDNIQHQDWLEAGIRYSSTKITLPGDDLMADVANRKQHYKQDEKKSCCSLDFSSICQRIAMSSLQGLPPLPRSLSGFNLNETRGEPPPPPARSSSRTTKGGKNIQPSTSRSSPSGRQLTTLDTQLAILRKEMFGLRQLDLSLLSQLWSLNESIQEFRQLLQDQEDRAPSPSPSSEEGDDVSYGNHPPAPPRRPGSLHHHHHHHHRHHRTSRPPRPLRPLPSDESPSSEEYGAV